MGRSLTHKLIESHLAAGKAVVGEEIGLGVDQVLLTDTNGIQSWLQFEALGFQRVVPARAVTYIDHNVYQVDSRNTDDHRYLQSVSRKYGALFSKPGNGICHQVHMESARRCSAPTATRRSAAPPACWRSAPAVSTWRWRWAAGRTS